MAGSLLIMRLRKWRRPGARSNCFSPGMKILIEQSKKCIDLQGDLMEEFICSQLPVLKCMLPLPCCFF